MSYKEEHFDTDCGLSGFARLQGFWENDDSPHSADFFCIEGIEILQVFRVDPNNSNISREIPVKDLTHDDLVWIYLSFDYDAEISECAGCGDKFLIEDLSEKTQKCEDCLRCGEEYAAEAAKERHEES